MAADKDLSIRKWWEQYAENPFAALDRLLCGRAFMGRLHRNESDEILFRLFHNKSNKVLRQLDRTMQDWFTYNWGKTPTSMPSSRWARILQNAFIATSRLKLESSLRVLKDLYTTDKSWIRSLYNTPARDPEGWLLRALALSQEDQKLLPLWMRLCRMEEDLPINYTSIALMGLRKLPERDGSPQGDLPGAFFKGAIYLAEALGKRKKKGYMDFWLREMRAIVALYPRSRQYWARYFYPFFYNRSDSLPAQWLNKVIPKLSNYFKPKGAVYVQPPTIERMEHFLELIESQPLEKFRDDFETFLEHHRSYAYNTGDSYFLIRTFFKIVSKLYKQVPTLASELVEEAFAWGPYDPFLWSQRAVIEVFRGNILRAVALLWEARRQFPENLQIKTTLAYLLEKQGKYKIAKTFHQQVKADEQVPQTEDIEAHEKAVDEEVMEDENFDFFWPEQLAKGASLVKAKEPEVYGKSTSKTFILPVINEIEAEIGEISLELWLCRHTEGKEKEQSRQRVSAALEKLLEKAPDNIPALLLKGLWLCEYKIDESENFLSRQAEFHPNTPGFHLLCLRAKSLKDKIVHNSKWKNLVKNFPNRSTIIKLEHVLCILDNLDNTANKALKELEQLRKLLLKDLDSLPTSLQRSEKWVRNTIKHRLFNGLDMKKPLSSQSVEKISESFEENVLVLRDTVDQIICSAV